MTRFTTFHRLVIAAASLLLLAAGAPPPAVATARTAWQYQETTGKQVKKFQWRQFSLVNREVIAVHEDNGIFVNHCDRAGRTLSWQFRRGESTEIQAVRRGNELLISGILEGKRIDRTHTLDERPWYQPLSFSLRFFLQTGVPETSFWTIRSDTLDVVTMRARRQGLDEVEVAGQPVSASRVEIRRDGLLSSFWHGSFWFRENDGLFVRYRGVHGPPGSSETVVQLQGEKGR